METFAVELKRWKKTRAQQRKHSSCSFTSWHFRKCQTVSDYEPERQSSKWPPSYTWCPSYQSFRSVFTKSSSECGHVVSFESFFLQHNKPGQSLGKQVLFSADGPSQGLPPCAVPTHWRVRVAMPSAHVTLHSLHSDHASYHPSTEKRHKVNDLGFPIFVICT